MKITEALQIEIGDHITCKGKEYTVYGVIPDTIVKGTRIRKIVYFRVLPLDLLRRQSFKECYKPHYMCRKENV